MRKLGGTALIVVAIGLAACSSSSPSSTHTTATKAPTTTSDQAPITTSTGASSSSSGAASAKQLGQAFVTSLQDGDYGSFCAFATADQVAKCKSDIAEAGSSTTFKNIALGSVVVQGGQALITLTGTVCVSGQCQSESNPNAATANSTFAKTYAQASNSNDPNGSFFVSAGVEQGGRWYATGF